MSATISKSQVQKLAKTMENINNVLQGLTVNESKISTKSAKQSAKPVVKKPLAKKKKSIDNVESKSDLKKYTVAELSSFADKHRIKYTKKLKELLIKKIWKYLCSFDSDSSDSDSSDSDSSDSSDSDSDSSDSSDSDSDSD